ncbi:MAG: response regulator [Chitinophagaceae bacterium]|nr:response regulator [Chitinophagaceae bacterium]
MKPVLSSFKGNPRLKQILAFSAVILVLFVGIAVNYIIELKVLHSVQDHNAKNDSVILQQKYQQVVEKTMFLISQADHSLERFIQTGDSAKLEEFKNNSTIVGGNLELIKTSYAVYVPKYLVNIFIHKAKNRLALNNEILETYTAKGAGKALEILNGGENKRNLSELSYGAQELVNTMSSKISSLNLAIASERTSMLNLDKKWNLISLVFMLLIAFLVLYKMIETNRLNNSLSIAVQKEHSALMVKDQFISNVTHELRTPLNSIIGYTNLLLKKDHNQETKQWIYAMKVSGNLLMEVINDVLDYSKLESGYIQFSKEPFALNDVLSNLKNVIQNRADSKNLLLIIEKDEQVPVHLLGDEKKLMQLLVNLTGNSIKFTDSGSIKVQVKLGKITEGKAWLQFIVSDTGIGIDEKKMPHIFERFYQVDSGLQKKYFGTGLGLPIVKQLVEMQGGTITAVSSPGMGTKFEVLLPYFIDTDVEIHSLVEEIEVIEEDDERNEQLKILIVDDNEMNRDLLGFILKEHNYSFEKAENGLVALKMLKYNSYYFIIMDVQMPHLNGIETTRKIRAELKIQTPVIGLSAFSQPEEQQASIHAGMNAYLTKPIDDVKLFELLEYYKDWNALPTPSQLKLINIEYLERITGGSKEYVEEVLLKAADLLPTEVKKLQDSFAAEDAERVKEVAHNMKTTLGILGVKEVVSNKVRQLEKADITKPSEKEQMSVLVAELDHSVKIVLEELKEYLNAA